MTIGVGNFLVIPEIAGTGKNTLVKVLKVEDKNKYRVVSQIFKRDGEGKIVKRQKFDVKAKSIIVDLGQNPRSGKVYGVSVEPLRHTIETNSGPILSFVELSKEEQSTVTKAISRNYSRLEKRRLLRYTPNLEIRAREGKYAGFYKNFPKGEDVLCLKFDFKEYSNEEADYIIQHEYAHCIWYRMLTRRSHARWIQLYDKHMALSHADEKDLKDILEEIESAGSIKGFLKEADEEVALVVKECLKQIKHVHGIDKHHLETLMRQHESIKDYWPSFVEFSEKNVLVSEYARKNPEELFAEAFAFDATGKKIPKEILKLLETSLSSLTKGGDDLPEQKKERPAHEEPKKFKGKKKKKK